MSDRPDLDDDSDDDVAADDYEDEVAAEGNRVLGANSRAVVEHVARSLAEEPDEVDVEVRERSGEVALLVHASPDDMGRLIGRRGRVIQALRQVTRAAGAAEGIRASVDVAE